MYYRTLYFHVTLEEQCTVCTAPSKKCTTCITEKKTTAPQSSVPLVSHLCLPKCSTDTELRLLLSFCLWLFRTDFIITASQDGHVKFWKKNEEEGIEFVKHFRSHLGTCLIYHPLISAVYMTGGSRKDMLTSSHFVLVSAHCNVDSNKLFPVL